MTDIEITAKISDDLDVIIGRHDVLIRKDAKLMSISRQDFRAIAEQIGEYERLVAFQKDTVAA